MAEEKQEKGEEENEYERRHAPQTDAPKFKAPPLNQDKDIDTEMKDKE